MDVKQSGASQSGARQDPGDSSLTMELTPLGMQLQAWKIFLSSDTAIARGYWKLLADNVQITLRDPDDIEQCRQDMIDARPDRQDVSVEHFRAFERNICLNARLYSAWTILWLTIFPLWILLPYLTQIVPRNWERNGTFAGIFSFSFGILAYVITMLLGLFAMSILNRPFAFIVNCIAGHAAPLYVTETPNDDAQHTSQTEENDRACDTQTGKR